MLKYSSLRKAHLRPHHNYIVGNPGKCVWAGLMHPSFCWPQLLHELGIHDDLYSTVLLLTALFSVLENPLLWLEMTFSSH